MTEPACLESLPTWAHAFNDEMIDFWSGEVLWNLKMADFTTYRVGGRAEAIILPAGINELARLLQGIKRLNLPWRLIGGGSNILVADEGLPGITLIIGKRFAEIEVVDEVADRVTVKVAAGCSLARLVSWAAEQGLGGLEFATGIPGTVGGALVMNAGAWGSEMCQRVQAVTIMDENGDYATKGIDSLCYGYRSWGEEAGRIAVHGFLQLVRTDREAIKATCQQMAARRKASQPREASCGSFFKNPGQGKSAGQLIEEAGLKGRSVGGAMVSPLHANFLVNTGNARARDLIELMKLVRREVEKRCNVRLEPEVKLLGFGATPC